MECGHANDVQGYSFFSDALIRFAELSRSAKYSRCSNPSFSPKVGRERELDRVVSERPLWGLCAARMYALLVLGVARISERQKG